MESLSYFIVVYKQVGTGKIRSQRHMFVSYYDTTLLSLV